MPQEWFVRRGDKERGPLTSEELKQLVAKKILARTDMIRKSESSEWRNAGMIKGLFVPETSTPSVTPPMSQVNVEIPVASVTSPPSQTSANRKAFINPSPASKTADTMQAGLADIMSTAKQAKDLTASHARRTQLARMTLPKAYLALGNDVFVSGRYREECSDLFQRITEADNEIAKVAASNRERPEATDLKGKLQSGAAQVMAHGQTTKLGFQRDSLVRSLGKRAFELHGNSAGSPELMSPIIAASEEVAVLSDKITQLSSGDKGPFWQRIPLAMLTVFCWPLRILSAWMLSTPSPALSNNRSVLTVRRLVMIGVVCTPLILIFSDLVTVGTNRLDSNGVTAESEKAASQVNSSKNEGDVITVAHVEKPAHVISGNGTQGLVLSENGDLVLLKGFPNDTLWRTATQLQIPLNPPIVNGTFSPDGKFLAGVRRRLGASADDSYRIDLTVFDVSAERPVVFHQAALKIKKKFNSSDTASVHWSRSGRHIVLLPLESLVTDLGEIVDLQTDPIITRVLADPRQDSAGADLRSAPHLLQFTSDGSAFCVQVDDETCLYEIPSGSLKHFTKSIRKNKSAVPEFIVPNSPGGKYGGVTIYPEAPPYRDTVEIWDAETLSKVFTYTSSTEGSLDVVFSSDDSRLTIGEPQGSDPERKVFSLPDGKLLFNEPYLPATNWHPTGFRHGWKLVAFPRGPIEVWSADGAWPVAILGTSDGYERRFSAISGDGKVVASTYQDSSTTEIWKLENSSTVPLLQFRQKHTESPPKQPVKQYFTLTEAEEAEGWGLPQGSRELAPQVSLRNFKLLREGMTKYDVQDILGGGPHKLLMKVSRHKQGTIVQLATYVYDDIYVYSGESPNSVVILRFRKDEDYPKPTLVEIQQRGLE